MKTRVSRSIEAFIESHIIEQIILIALIAFVGMSSFILGRLSALEKPQEEPVIAVMKESSSFVVASRKGTKYHFPWCSGASRINPDNLIEYSSVSEAKAAGLSPALNCKGLK